MPTHTPKERAKLKAATTKNKPAKPNGLTAEGKRISVARARRRKA